MTKPYAMLRAGFPYLQTIGVKGMVDDPRDVAFGKNDRIYVLGDTITILTLDHEVLGKIGHVVPKDTDLGSEGLDFQVEKGGLYQPCQIITDSKENLYVSDEATHKITVFSSDGDILQVWCEYGSGPNQLNKPSGLVSDSEDNIYVVDTMNHRVQKFTKDGPHLMSWGSYGTRTGEFRMPWGIARDSDGNIYVADWRNDRVQKFTAEGEFLFQFGNTGREDGQFLRPSGLAVDKDYDIYVSDWGNNRVQLFNPDGRYVEKFLGDATMSDPAIAAMRTRLRTVRIRDSAALEYERLFRGPRSVRVDEIGRMFVPDYESYRIQVYQKHAIQLEENEIGPELTAPTLSAN